MTTEKERFAIVAILAATAGAVITSIIDRFALRQDLEFLGIAHKQVQDELADLNKKVEGEENGN
jgi:hypothetical protein